MIQPKFNLGQKVYQIFQTDKGEWEINCVYTRLKKYQYTQYINAICYINTPSKFYKQEIKYCIGFSDNSNFIQQIDIDKLVSENDLFVTKNQAQKECDRRNKND